MKEPTSVEQVRRFLFDHVATYDQLEVLLCLHRERDRDVQPADCARGVGLSDSACRLALEELSARGLATRSADAGSFRYSPASEALARGVQELVRAYHTARLAVIRAMNENALQRVRSSAALAFPDPPGVRKPP